MTEEQQAIQRLSARLDAVEQLLRVTLATMPDNQRQFLLQSADEYARKARDVANRTQADIDLDIADAAWELAQKLPADDWNEQFFKPDPA